MKKAAFQCSQLNLVLQLHFPRNSCRPINYITCQPSQNSGTGGENFFNSVRLLAGVVYYFLENAAAKHTCNPLITSPVTPPRILAPEEKNPSLLRGSRILSLLRGSCS